MKFIIIHCSPLTRRWYDYYCIKELTEAFDFEYWDCSRFVYPHFIVDNPIEEVYTYQIHDVDELDYRLQTLDRSTLIAMDIHRCEQNYKVLKRISKYRKDVISLDFFSNTINQTRLRNFLDDYTHIKSLRRKFFSFLFKRMFHNIHIGCSLDSNYRINHPDYETFLKIQDEKPLFPGKRYAVYIDNNFPFHPEIKYREQSLDIASIADGFYNSLNKFFDKVERIHNCKIVIAAHPAAHYDKNPYGKRTLINNQTGLLIRDSIGVLMHTSNAVSLAYLYNKPVAHLYNSWYIKSKMEYRRLLQCSKQLGFPMINTDTDNGTNVFDCVKSISDREEYIIKYLTDINDNRSNSLKIVEYLKNIWSINNIQN